MIDLPMNLFAPLIYKHKINQSMSSWINESRFVQNLAQNMLTAKRSYYQQDYIKFKVTECKQFSYKNVSLFNGFGEKIRATVFNSSQQNQYCIIYLHGFGSHRLEGTTILSSLPIEFGLCCFDFSGSGKSQGDISAYGIKEYLDIKPVLEMLKQQYKFKKFVLWGRSMGAVASLLYTSLPQTEKQNILFQVLDSPFSSFESIAKHHAHVSYNFPQLFIDFGLQILKNHFQPHKFNPFKINLAKVISQCQVPALFVYSEEDGIIPPQNSIAIIQNFNTKILYEKLIIQQNHNNFRTKETLNKIMEIIKKYVSNSKVREKVKYKRGIHQVCSNPATPKNKHKHIKITKLSGTTKYGLNQKKIINTKRSEEEFITAGDLSYCFKNCSRVEEERQ